MTRLLVRTQCMQGLTLMHLIWLVFGAMAALAVGTEVGAWLHGYSVHDLTPGA